MPLTANHRSCLWLDIKGGTKAERDAAMAWAKKYAEGRTLRADEMKRLELWRWRYFDPVRKRKVTTTFALSEADAAVQYPQGAEKVEGSLEVRNVPETDEEQQAASTSAFTRKPPGSTQ